MLRLRSLKVHDAFQHLEKQITNLAQDDFAAALEDSHEEATRAVAKAMPFSSSHIEPSAQLRMAYVEHTVSAIITRRIFEPFLFVLSGRLRPADELFVEMSQNLKRKSVRREALWRQRTLHAAFTAASAKQSINRIATRIVDEIIDAVKPFAHRARWQHVTVAVRHIVKTAAETWRYARLESPLIIASMDSDDITQGVRGEIAQHPGHAPASESGRQVLFSLFPTIRREAIRESLPGEFKSEDQGCVYSPGRVFYADNVDGGPDAPSLHAAQSPPASSSNSYHSIETGSARGSLPHSPLVPASTGPKAVVADVARSESRLDDRSDGEQDHKTNKPAPPPPDTSITLASEGDKQEASSRSGSPSHQSSPGSSVSDRADQPAEKAASIPDWSGAGESIPVMKTGDGRSVA